jgi:hypothetical protein
MIRILVDKTGEYDLSRVIAIVRIPWQEKMGGTVINQGETAKLILDGGQSVSTSAKYDDVAAAWRAVKSAEGHPVDEARGVTVENQLTSIELHRAQDSED